MSVWVAHPKALRVSSAADALTRANSIAPRSRTPEATALTMKDHSRGVRRRSPRRCDRKGNLTVVGVDSAGYECQTAARHADVEGASVLLHAGRVSALQEVPNDRDDGNHKQDMHES